MIIHITEMIELNGNVNRAIPFMHTAESWMHTAWAF